MYLKSTIRKMPDAETRQFMRIANEFERGLRHLQSQILIRKEMYARTKQNLDHYIGKNTHSPTEGNEETAREPFESWITPDPKQ